STPGHEPLDAAGADTVDRRIALLTREVEPDRFQAVAIATLAAGRLRRQLLPLVLREQLGHGERPGIALAAPIGLALELRVFVLGPLPRGFPVRRRERVLVAPAADAQMHAEACAVSFDMPWVSHVPSLLQLFGQSQYPTWSFVPLEGA